MPRGKDKKPRKRKLYQKISDGLARAGHPLALASTVGGAGLGAIGGDLATRKLGNRTAANLITGGASVTGGVLGNLTANEYLRNQRAKRKR